jgi:cobalamin biosynthesis Mg chelatase CobN
MSYWIYIQLKDKTFQDFQHIFQQMNQAHAESLSKPLGDVLTEISCEVIDQVFSVIRSQKFKGVGETEHTLEQITENLKKYMPWAISLFSNERLLPMVGYIYHQMEEQNGQWFLKYRLDELLAVEALNCVEQLDLGQSVFIAPTFDVFVKIIDQGVDCLIREPKKMLKFNVVVDKTLNGVINLTTQLGYKRIDKIASHFDIDASRTYFHYFMGFLKKCPE